MAPLDRDHFRAHGWLVTAPLFDAATLAGALAEIDRLWRERSDRIAATGAQHKADYTRARPELQRLHLESDVLAAFCRHDALVEAAGALLGGDLDLSFNQAYAKAPGGDARTEIPWHQDAYYAEIDGASCNCWVAITRTTVANGTIVRAPLEPHVLPHTWDHPLTFYRCAIDEATARPVELEPGQAFFFSGRLPHRSGVNRSGERRVAYSISFTAASARLRQNGERFGDRVAVLRSGRPMRELFAAYVDGGDDPSGPAAVVAREIAARAATRAGEAAALLAAFAAATRAGDAGEADRLLGRYLALLPHEEEILGDVVRARARVDQLLDELATIRGRDARAEQRLLERLRQLAPDHPLARALATTGRP